MFLNTQINIFLKMNKNFCLNFLKAKLKSSLTQTPSEENYRSHAWSLLKTFLFHPSSSFFFQSHFPPFSSVSASPSLNPQIVTFHLLRMAEVGCQDLGWGKMYHGTRLLFILLCPGAGEEILIPFLSTEWKEGEQLSLRTRVCVSGGINFWLFLKWSCDYALGL